MQSLVVVSFNLNLIYVAFFFVSSSRFICCYIVVVLDFNLVASLAVGHVSSLV